MERKQTEAEKLFLFSQSLNNFMINNGKETKIISGFNYNFTVDWLKFEAISPLQMIFKI